MAIINSVLGKLNTADLGFTHMHEHIISTAAGIPQNYYPELLGIGFMDRIIDALTQARKEGIDTIVDASPANLGRDISVLAEASRRSGINIIACAGWYRETPRSLSGVSADKFARLFISDIREGINGTGIKAGILKAASDVEGVKPTEETVLRAVARAHMDTSVPIMLHSYSPGQVGRQQLAILKEEGVDMRRVKVDHCLDTTDLRYLTWLLEQGCYLGMETRRPGISGAAGLEDHLKTLKALIDAGYAHRICLSHDHAVVAAIFENSPEVKRDSERHNPYGLLYTKKVVFPRLREMGIQNETLNSLCMDAPRSFFEGA